MVLRNVLFIALQPLAFASGHPHAEGNFTETLVNVGEPSPELW